MNRFLVKCASGEVLGPLTAIELKRMAQEGRITPACMVRRDGDDEARWHSAGGIKGLDFGGAGGKPAASIQASTSRNVKPAGESAAPRATADAPAPQPPPGAGAREASSTKAGAGGGWLLVLIGFAALYFGGWRMVWSLPRWEASSYAGVEGTPPALILEGDCVAFKVGDPVNARYFGLGYRDRFFNSPVLSWVVGIAGGFMILGGLGNSGSGKQSNG